MRRDGERSKEENEEWWIMDAIIHILGQTLSVSRDAPVQQTISCTNPPNRMQEIIIDKHKAITMTHGEKLRMHHGEQWIHAIHLTNKATAVSVVDDSLRLSNWIDWHSHPWIRDKRLAVCQTLAHITPANGHNTYHDITKGRNITGYNQWITTNGIQL